MQILKILFLFGFSTVFGQLQLSGVITDLDGLTVGDAQVFLDGTSVFDVTNENGLYTLQVTQGRYDLVIRHPDYEKVKLEVFITQNKVLNIELTQTIELDEVEVLPYDNKFWEESYEIFKRNFLGTTPNGLKSKIKNKRIIKFRTTKENQRAFAKEPLIIKNPNLGYDIVFYLDFYEIDFQSRIVRFEGTSYYTERKGNKAQQKKWRKNRADAYLGSINHFIRAMYHNQLKEEGFRVRRILRKLNPERPTDEVIDSVRLAVKGGNGFFFNINNPSPEFEILHKAKLPKYISFLIEQSLESSAFLKEEDGKKIFFFPEPDWLQIIYVPKDEFNTIALETELEIFSIGSYYPVGLLVTDTECLWSKSKVGDMVPWNYSPAER